MFGFCIRWFLKFDISVFALSNLGFLGFLEFGVSWFRLMVGWGSGILVNLVVSGVLG